MKNIYKCCGFFELTVSSLFFSISFFPPDSHACCYSVILPVSTPSSYPGVDFSRTFFQSKFLPKNLELGTGKRSVSLGD